MKYRSNWQIQKFVFYALFIREFKTRFGGFRLGVFWALLEPIAHILVLTTLFSLMQRGGFFGVPFPVFFATGVLTFFIFQKIVSVSIASIKSNMGLFSYRQVKPFDAIVVRATLELLVIISVMIFTTWLGIWVFNYECLPKNPLVVVFIIFGLFLLSLGLGFFSAVIGVKYPEAAQLINIIMRPLYFISGIFFPLEFMPKEYHIYLLWNPILHAVEQFRAAWINGYPPGDTSLIFLYMWALPLFFLGLAYCFNNRTKVLMS